MATRYRRRSLQEFMAAGNRLMRGIVVLSIVVATYGLVDRISW